MRSARCSANGLSLVGFATVLLVLMVPASVLASSITDFVRAAADVVAIISGSVR